MIRLLSLQQHPRKKSQFWGGEVGAGPSWPSWEPCGAKNKALGGQAPVRSLWGRACPGSFQVSANQFPVVLGLTEVSVSWGLWPSTKSPSVLLRLLTLLLLQPSPPPPGPGPSPAQLQIPLTSLCLFCCFLGTGHALGARVTGQGYLALPSISVSADEQSKFHP